jgi:hypothetical protein
VSEPFFVAALASIASSVVVAFAIARIWFIVHGGRQDDAGPDRKAALVDDAANEFERECADAIARLNGRQGP